MKPEFFRLADIFSQIKRYYRAMLTRDGGQTMMQGDMKFFLCMLGLVLVLEGLPYFAFPDKMKTWVKKIQETPDSQLRMMGFAAMCAGLVLVYLFR